MAILTTTSTLTPYTIHYSGRNYEYDPYRDQYQMMIDAPPKETKPAPESVDKKLLLLVGV